MNQTIMRLVAAVLTATTTTAATAFAEGRQHTGNRFSPEALQRAIRESTPSSVRAPRAQPSGGSTRKKDSVWNGGVIGAVVGGVGGSLMLIAATGGSDDIGRAMLN